MIELLHGADAFAVAERVQAMRAAFAAEDAMAELNASVLDGARLTVPELRAAADALPFMGGRRLVVVRGLVGRCSARSGEKNKERRTALANALLAYLPHVPPTTDLVLVEGEIETDNPVAGWLRTAAGRASPADGEANAVVARAFDPPPPERLPAWITARAVGRGGAFAPAASSALAAALAPDGPADLWRVDSEVEKLLTWAGERRVEADDVVRLVAPIDTENVYRLIEALAERDGPAAATLLHTFLSSGEEPISLLSKIARQFHQLAHVRALMDGGVPPSEHARAVGVPPFVARKLATQARRFSAPFLDAALKRLLDIDVGIKTGRTVAVTALDLFVAGVCGTGAAARTR
ncbi:MAG: DNA polymerase III subunit delta [Ardenticatenales bacterium]|mgnify:CR=1 FL=1|nr:DNA polymerase III subunit delta [Ardenticatenales bacterium]